MDARVRRRRHGAELLTAASPVLLVLVLREHFDGRAHFAVGLARLGALSVAVQNKIAVLCPAAAVQHDTRYQ